MAKRRKVKEGISKKFTLIGAFAGILALIISIFGVVSTSNLSNSIPKKPQMQQETLAFSRVENYAKNFFQVWAMGDPASVPKLREFYSAIAVSDLNPDPVEISELNVADLKVQPTPKGEILWTVTMGATTKSPGVTAPSRNYYDISVLQKGESLAIAKLPVIVELNRNPLTATNAYGTPVGSNSPLYQVSVNFAATYLTPQNSESFGRYVTAEFKGNPLKSSPYTSVSVVGVYVPSNTVLENFKAGEKTSTLIRVKASTSRSTYQTMDLIVTAVVQPNGQWLINSIDEVPLTDKSREEKEIDLNKK